MFFRSLSVPFLFWVSSCSLSFIYYLIPNGVNGSQVNAQLIALEGPDSENTDHLCSHHIRRNKTLGPFFFHKSWESCWNEQIAKTANIHF